MACSRCGSDRLFQFEASKNAVERASLPVACRNCGLITVDGQALAFPAEFELQAKQLADVAAEAGQETKDAILKDPEARISAYFANVYRRAYLDGFVRAFMYAQHHAKEGRLRRVRELWKEHRPLAHLAEKDCFSIQLPKAAYDELRWLLEIGDRHGSRAEDQHSTGETGHARVP